MIPKHCRDCGTEARPRLYHPSSLRAEISVWLAALAVGAGAGLWSVVTSPPAAPETTPYQRVALSVMGGVSETPAAPTPVPAAPSADLTRGDGPVWQAALWLRDLALDFLRTAWWVLPLPLAFSLWRQFTRREGCIECGSRHLDPTLPVPDPF